MFAESIIQGQLQLLFLLMKSLESKGHVNLSQVKIVFFSIVFKEIILCRQSF